MDNDNKPAFTPKPWEVWKGHRAIYANVRYNTESSISGKMICQMDEEDEEDLVWAGGEGQINEADANFQLMSSAPDLYEALKEMVHLHTCEMEGISSGMPTAAQWYAAYQKAVKALAKAEGKGGDNG